MIELPLGDERTVGHDRLPVHAGDALVVAGCYMMVVWVRAAKNMVLFQLRKVKEVV